MWHFHKRPPTTFNDPFSNHIINDWQCCESQQSKQNPWCCCSENEEKKKTIMFFVKSITQLAPGRLIETTSRTSSPGQKPAHQHQPVCPFLGGPHCHREKDIQPSQSDSGSDFGGNKPHVLHLQLERKKRSTRHWSDLSSTQRTSLLNQLELERRISFSSHQCFKGRVGVCNFIL